MTSQLPHSITATLEGPLIEKTEGRFVLPDLPTREQRTYANIEVDVLDDDVAVRMLVSERLEVRDLFGVDIVEEEVSEPQGIKLEHPPSGPSLGGLGGRWSCKNLDVRGGVG